MEQKITGVELSRRLVFDRRVEQENAYGMRIAAIGAIATVCRELETISVYSLGDVQMDTGSCAEFHN